MGNKVSVIVPAYNCSKYINKCIDSIINQTYDDIEPVIVNDGSKDNTREILEQYGDKIKLINKENAGVAEARNTGIKAATGDYIMFLDSDDYLELDCIEDIVTHQKKYNCDIVRFSYKIVYEDGKQTSPINYFTEEKLIQKSEFKENIYSFFISGIRFNSVWATLYKSDIIKDLSFLSGLKTAEDAIFSLNAYTNAQTVFLYPKQYYNYFQTGAGLTGSGLSVVQKYKCNFIFAKHTLKLLNQWGMGGIKYRILTLMRPIRLTFDKIKRSKS